ncbi:hypothetical protein PAALTS15_05713 [Paenibacillus alvei TS-15]|uniref:Uncharacterized protein n=1 Tax=Paenibacillus alvei TS-15 TaxID=1117108 RepID=S9UCL9_PAEAL|nr:hypothetical protein [Paenibacillus alvei]EPY08200.1 hypothetical protein PAALTS15_05713 [Paenibacillus alvei TS-15]
MKASHTNLLLEGLQIVSRCKSETRDIWHAHFGIASIASYFYMKENELPDAVRERIQEQAEAMLHKHRLGHSRQSDESQLEIEHDIAGEIIVQALERTIDELHWVGHNVIYTALSLLAIKELGKWGTRSEVEGIVHLIHSFEKTIPGRSWVGYTTSKVKKLEIKAEDVLPHVNNPADLSAFILTEMSAFKTIYQAEAHHDLIGHMLTFSHALNVLFDLGHRSLFDRGLIPLFQLVKVLRSSVEFDPEYVKLYSPVDRLPLSLKKRSPFLPDEESFWTNEYDTADWDFGHVFKFSYSYFDHVKRAPHLREETIEQFRYVIHS